MVIAMLDAIVAHDDDAQPGLVLALRLAYRASGHRFNVAIAGNGIAVVMTGEKIFHAELVKQTEVRGTAFARDIEVLVRLVGALQKPGMMLEDHNVLRAVIASALQ